VEPEVTVTMAAWRVEPRWFLEAVHSVLDQRDCNLELVVVDDGSPEPVAGVLAGIEDPRLRVVRIDHGGHTAARNAGIAHARGRLLRFVDADDVLEPESTGRLAALIGDRDDVVAHGATIVCDEWLNPVRTIASAFEGDVTKACLLGRFEVRHVSMLFPRRVVDLAGPWNGTYRISGDWDFVLRALEHADARADPLPATYYRRHAGSAQSAASVASGEDARGRIIRGYFERHPEQRGTALERGATAAMLLDYASAYAASGSGRAAASRLFGAARLAPLPTVALTARLLARRLRRQSRR
jgi:glycosyltransferase involved in cell wall biosynthesis